MVSQIACTPDGQRELETGEDYLVRTSTVYHLCGILFMNFWEPNPKQNPSTEMVCFQKGFEMKEIAHLSMQTEGDIATAR